MEQLDSEDKILLGGPFVDAKGLVIILKATSKDEADRIMSQEPIILGKLFSTAEDHEMQISVAGS